MTQLANDSPVPPAPALAGQLQDEVVQLVAAIEPAATRSAPIRRPPAPDQFPMPAEQGLGSGQERSPVRPWQDTAKRSQHQTIGGLPARPANLALQHRELGGQLAEYWANSDTLLLVQQHGADQSRSSRSV